MDEETVDRFLARVIEIEENPAYAKKGQESNRKDQIIKALEEFCG